MIRILRSWWVGAMIVWGLSTAMVFAPRDGHAQAQPQPLAAANTILAEALIQFEAATQWEAMRPSWRDRRPFWIAQVRGATSAQALASLMVEFETIMTWEAMPPRWHQDRPVWIARSRAAVTPHDVAQAMIALEGATTWSAMYEARWRSVRAGWVARLQGI